MQRGALNQQEAAKWLGMSVNHFKAHVRPQLSAAYVGGKTLYSVKELQRWLDSVTNGT